MLALCFSFCLIIIDLISCSSRLGRLIDKLLNGSELRNFQTFYYLSSTSGLVVCSNRSTFRFWPLPIQNQHSNRNYRAKRYRSSSIQKSSVSFLIDKLLINNITSWITQEIVLLPAVNNRTQLKLKLTTKLILSLISVNNKNLSHLSYHKQNYSLISLYKKRKTP